MSKFSVFVQTVEQIEPLINAGALHLILEDSKVAIRSFSDDFSTPGFGKLLQLANTAKKLSPDIELSVNCDLMAHERHFPLLHQLITELIPSSLRRIRLQDPGLIAFFKENLPDVQIHLNLETGNHTATGMNAYSQYCYSQTVSNELPYADITLIRKQCQFPLEIHVFGPLLLQYSNRRFLEGTDQVHPNQSYNRYIKYAQDHDFPGRKFTFYDNPHGHFMYAYFDRCLLKALNNLQALNMDYWLIDGRGESLSYTLTALEAFKTGTPAHFKLFQSQFPRPLKLGFFRANQTDQVHLSKPHLKRENLKWAGTVVDLIKPSAVTIECHHPITVGDTLLVITPRFDEHELTINKLQTLQGEGVTSSSNHTFVQIPWYKGSHNKARLYKI